MKVVHSPHRTYKMPILHEPDVGTTSVVLVSQRCVGHGPPS